MSGGNGQAAPPVVVNEGAGALAGGDLLDSNNVKRWLEAENGRDNVRVVSGKDLTKQLDRLMRQGHDRIAVAGGDGTISAAAARCIERGIELVALPAGTLNHYCTDLGIPTNADEWPALLASERTARVDVGDLNGRTFVNNFSIGLYPKLVELRGALPNDRLLGSKRLATALSALKLALKKPKPVEIRWRTDEDSADEGVTTQAALVSNNAYADEPFNPFGRSTVDEGRLRLYAPQSLNPGTVLTMAEASLRGRLDECDDLVTVDAQELTLMTRKHRVAVAVDGELLRLKTPLVARIRGRALTIVLPEPESASAAR